jgi:dephospho-CoA kinase
MLLQSFEVRQRGMLREVRLRNIPVRCVQSNGTLHIPVNDPVSTTCIRESYRFPHQTHRFLPLPAAQSDHDQNANIPVVGIVGGVGSGKSSVVKEVTELQLFVIDADQIGHGLLLSDEIRRKLCDVFGETIFDDVGYVVRERLAEKVFGSSEEQTANRHRLNKILHPAIRDEIVRLIRQPPQDAEAIILDAALLLEAGWADECDAVVFIDTPDDVRQQRVAANRGWSKEELQRREASQWNLARKRQHAQFVIDNSGALEVAARQMTVALQQIVLERRSFKA